MPGFWTNTPSGMVLHVNGNPRMSDDALAAITEVAELAMRHYLRRQLVAVLRARAASHD